MGRATPSPEEGNHPSERAQVDAAIAAFRGALSAGRKPQIEETLSSAPETARPGLLRSLLILELAYRLRIGERPTPEEFRTRFPSQVNIVEDALRHPAVASLLSEPIPY